MKESGKYWNNKMTAKPFIQRTRELHLDKHLLHKQKEWDHLFGTYRKISEKLLFPTTWYTHVNVRIRRSEILIFGKFCVRTKWMNPICIKLLFKSTYGYNPMQVNVANVRELKKITSYNNLISFSGIFIRVDFSGTAHYKSL